MNTDKNEVMIVDAETAITLQTVSDLTRLANEAINAYNATHPIYNKLTQRVLDTLSDDEVFDSLDSEELMKLIALTSKNQLAPIQELAKLVTQLNALKEKFDADKEIAKLRAIVEELKSARDKNELHMEVLDDEEDDELVLENAEPSYKPMDYTVDADTGDIIDLETNEVVGHIEDSENTAGMWVPQEEMEPIPARTIEDLLKTKL